MTATLKTTNIQHESAGTANITLTSGGNVGIATTSPSYMLSLGKGTTSVNEQAVLFLQSGNGTGGARDYSIEGDGSGSLLFKDRGYNNGNNGIGEIMRLTFGSNVGIGTTSPTCKLQVDGTDGTIARFRTTSGANNTVINITSSDAAGTAGFSVGGNSSFPNMTFENGGSERMRINSSGNVGIGTTSPSHSLDVIGNTNTSVISRIGNLSTGSASRAIVQIGAGATAERYVNLNTNYTNQYFQISGTSITTCYQDFDTQIFRNNSATERMRINSSGNLRIGTTAGNADAAVTAYGGATDSSPALELFKGSTTNTASQVFMRFEVGRDSTAVASGSITANGAAAATFTSWSDRRLKKNIVDLPPQLENICKLKPSEFDFIDYPEGEGHQVGFIAQDMREVYPDVVSEGKNGILQISGWSKTEARLVKAIQEQQEIIKTLEARVASLEAN